MGYVIMPNHVHFLIGSAKGGTGISEFFHSFKALVRIRNSGKKRIWEDGFDDLEIKQMEQFYIKLNYIHNNPVKRGLVAEPGEWKYSSFKFWTNDKPDSNLVKDFEWMSGKNDIR